MRKFNFRERPNYRAWEIESLVSLDIPREELLLHLVDWAILAPSSHNAQPWRFHIDSSGDTVSIYVDGEYILPASDKMGRQAFISVGCALENLLLAAESYGFGFKIEYKSGTPVYPSPVIVVRFDVHEELGGKVKLEMFELMKKRRMNRGKYDPSRQIPEALPEEMQSFTRGLGLTLDVITDTATRFAISEFQYLADRAVVMRNDFRSELARFLLPNDTMMARGMPGNTFGLSDEMAVRVHEELKKTGPFDPDFAFGFAASGRDGIKSAPALLVVSVGEDTPIWWVKAGRVLERIALIAEKYELSIAVHAAMVEVEMFNKLLKLRLRRRKRPTVICRIGYAIEERPHAPRASRDALMGGVRHA